MPVERRGPTIWPRPRVNPEGEEPMAEAKPQEWLDRKSRMKRELHVRICEGAGVRFPRATRRAPRRRGKETGKVA